MHKALRNLKFHPRKVAEMNSIAPFMVKRARATEVMLIEVGGGLWRINTSMDHLGRAFLCCESNV